MKMKEVVLNNLRDSKTGKKIVLKVPQSEIKSLNKTRARAREAAQKVVKIKIKK